MKSETLNMILIDADQDYLSVIKHLWRQSQLQVNSHCYPEENNLHNEYGGRVDTICWLGSRSIEALRVELPDSNGKECCLA